MGVIVAVSSVGTQEQDIKERWRKKWEEEGPKEQLKK